MPFINEIIFFFFFYSNLYRKYSDTDISEVDTAKLLKQFGNISEDLEELLIKNGIESFSIENDTVDFSKQKVIKTVTTCEQEKDKTVCDRLKKGFMMDGKIIRQEWISCYKYDNNNNSNNNNLNLD
jgi:molecular chaperone GrpE